MADIAKKITKLDEKIGKLKERIKSDTAECEKLSEQKALLIYQSLCKQYSCEGQALADMIAREHEQAATYNEELTEYQADKSLEELADLLEVIYAVTEAHGYSIEELKQLRREKAEKRGGFQKKLLLKEVVEND